VAGPHHRGRPDLLVPEQFRLVLGGLLLAAHRFPWASGSVLAGGHDGLKNRREVGAVDTDDPGVDLYAFSLPDETNRLTPRFEMASRSAASSRVISFPTFVLFLTDCRELRLVCV
jgi:hypothetical protein